MPIRFQTLRPIPAPTPAAARLSAHDARRSVWRALLHGACRRCPCCGASALFKGYLKTVDACERCGEEFHHHRADDAPPYFTMLVIGHLVVPLVLAVEMIWHPPIGLQLAFWLPATLAATLALLGVVKGALVALQWALRMHGFGPGDPDGRIDGHIDGSGMNQTHE